MSKKKNFVFLENGGYGQNPLKVARENVKNKIHAFGLLECF